MYHTTGERIWRIVGTGPSWTRDYYNPRKDGSSRTGDNGDSTPAVVFSDPGIDKRKISKGETSLFRLHGISPDDATDNNVVNATCLVISGPFDTPSSLNDLQSQPIGRSRIINDPGKFYPLSLCGFDPHYLVAVPVPQLVDFAGNRCLLPGCCTAGEDNESQKE